MQQDTRELKEVVSDTLSAWINMNVYGISASMSGAEYADLDLFKCLTEISSRYKV